MTNYFTINLHTATVTHYVRATISALVLTSLEIMSAYIPMQSIASRPSPYCTYEIWPAILVKGQKFMSMWMLSLLIAWTGRHALHNHFITISTGPSHTWEGLGMKLIVAALDCVVFTTSIILHFARWSFTRKEEQSSVWLVQSTWLGYHLQPIVCNVFM